MFLIKRKRLAFVVGYDGHKVVVRHTAESMALSSDTTYAILRGLSCLVNVSVKKASKEDKNNAIFQYFSLRGWDVEKLSPKIVETELGDILITYG